ncbi:inhibitor of growth protein 4 [Nematostella vectensis]|uniref:inhibitor of growth protein 4 n=1 Tax=Nematostella vectensis TaxID=45351 RepID=UPI00207773CB|nr:inhibitor of growth protein 4 [Nematostella vectensis]
MSGNMYLDHYLDGIETLPFELQRNFTLMKELDQRAQDLLKEIDNMSDKYVAEVRKMDALQRTDHLKKIENAFSKSKEYVDDKVQLAMQTYEMVDKHIRKLDHDLARFEADLKEERAKEAGLSSDYENDPTPPKRGRGRSSKKGDGESSKKKRKRESSPVKLGLPGQTLFSPEVVQVLDMPVDPNEPTYCICHQVSYGEMIGCDNMECPIEWFHFPCVGLVAKPKGKWYCPKCSQDRKKK